MLELQKSEAAQDNGLNRDHLRRALTSNQKPASERNTSLVQYSPNRGIALCGNYQMVDDILAILDQTRNVFNSSLNFAIMHCDELNGTYLTPFQSLKNVQVKNMCNGSGLFGMNYIQTKRKFNSWFCKTAAIIFSPFIETMVVDIDVVFFKQPDLLFNSPAYRKTGTLFFRDRLTHDKRRLKYPNYKILQLAIEEYIMKQSAAIHGRYAVSYKLCYFLWCRC